jgi:hypothetical protein
VKEISAFSVFGGLIPKECVWSLISGVSFVCMFFWLVPIVSGDDLVDIMHLNLPMMLHSSSDAVSTLEFHLCACFHASFDSVGCQTGNA